MIIKLDRTAFKRRLWQRAYQRQLAKKTDINIQRLVFYSIKVYGRWYEKPIKKEFDGQKYECKDYFYTKEYLSTIDLDEPISEPFKFLWEYWNSDTSKFLMNMTGAMNNIYKEQTGKGLVESFFEKEGFDF